MPNITDLLDTIIQSIVTGALTIASVYIPIVMGKIVEYAKSRTSLIKSEETKNLIINSIDRVDDLIATNIIAIENTIKPKILEAIKDGRIDKKELKELSILVKKNVIQQMNSDTSEVLNAILGDMNGYLENRIEKILAELKDAEGNVVSHTTV